MKSSRARQYTGIECPICGKFLDFSAAEAREYIQENIKL
jgi:hypothetical protein